MIIMEFKRIWLIAIILVGAFSVNAQENYFVYLQTENNQPFYARINNKVISSTTSGYLILPKITEGQYNVTIGFPKNEFGEENFTIDVNNRSEGYLLKDFGDKGWSLFNLQTLALVSPNTSDDAATGVASGSEMKEDPFSQMLASVTKDSTLLRKNTPIVMAPAVPVEEKLDSVKATEEVAVNTVPEKTNSEEVMETVAIVEEPVKEKATTGSEIIYNPEKEHDSQPVKILGVVGRDGSEMIYVDKTTNSTDTITVFIPNEKENTDSETVKIDVKEVPLVKKEPEYTITPTIVSPVKEESKETVVIEVKEESRNRPEIIYEEGTRKATPQVFIIRDDSSPKEKEEKSEDSIILLPEVSTKSTNSDCKDLANNNDFLRIRKRMASEKDNDAMVFAAKKIFKTKCFSTEQIRNLSYLFLSDEGRYMFFDAAYPYTSDTEKFPTLISQLKDDYYINRFEAMIQK